MTYNHKEYMKEYHKKNKERDREKNRARIRKWYLENKEKVIKKSNEWARANPGRRKITEKERMDKDYRYFLLKKLKRRLEHAIQHFSPDKSLTMAQYEIEWDKIISHLVNNFEEDRKLVIDHIKPICAFNINDKKQIQKAFAPENTRLISREKNQKKIKFDIKQSIYKK